jgi:hypothetical protein
MPLSSAVHSDQLLTTLSVGWWNDESNYIAGRVFPNVSVAKQSDKYRIFNKADWFRDDARRRADTTEAAETDFTLSEDTYYADVWALRTFIGDQTQANFDAPGNLLQDTTRFLTQKMLLQRDIQFTNDFLKTGVWALDKVGVASAPTGNGFIQWNDYTNSTPVLDVEVGKTAIASTTGIEANTLVLGRDVLATLRNHPDIIDRINYTGNGGRTGADEAILAGLFGVERVIVARAIKNTAAEGQAGVYGKISAAKAAFLCYSTPAPGLMTPTAGYTFGWNNIPGGVAGQPVAVKRYRNEDRASDVIEVQSSYDNKVVAPELGVFYGSVIA